jgi:hypothetical protein
MESNSSAPSLKRVYEDSLLMKALKDYSIVPDPKLQKKIDFYFSPYYSKYHIDKCKNYGIENRPKLSIPPDEKHTFN